MEEWWLLIDANEKIEVVRTENEEEVRNLGQGRHLKFIQKLDEAHWHYESVWKRERAGLVIEALKKCVLDYKHFDKVCLVALDRALHRCSDGDCPYLGNCAQAESIVRMRLMVEALALIVKQQEELVPLRRDYERLLDALPDGD